MMHKDTYWIESESINESVRKCKGHSNEHNHKSKVKMETVKQQRWKWKQWMWKSESGNESRTLRKGKQKLNEKENWS